MAIGTGSTMSEWDPALLRLLARDRRLILFDDPGIGLSSPLRGRSVTFEQLADTTADAMAASGKVTIPVLVTGGRRDPVTPPENARWIARRIPSAKLELFDDAHAYLFSERVRFTRVVRDFLD